MSLIIDTDGIFFVHGSSARGGSDDRHRALRAADRESLLAGDPRNRWIAAEQIQVADLRQRPWTAVGMRTWTLTIATIDGQQHRVFLVHDEQAELTRTYLPWLVSSRFVG